MGNFSLEFVTCMFAVWEVIKIATNLGHRNKVVFEDKVLPSVNPQNLKLLAKRPQNLRLLRHSMC